MILRLIKSISYRLSRFYFVIINFIIRELNDNLSLIYISFFNDYANKNTPNKKVPIILICRNKNHLPTVAESGESMEKFHLEDSIKKRKITGYHGVRFIKLLKVNIKYFTLNSF